MSFALAFAIEQSTSQPVISSVTIRGNHAFESPQILDWLPAKPGYLFSPGFFQNDLRLVIERYQEHGFLFVRIDSVQAIVGDDSSSVAVFVFLREGKAATVRSIEFRGNTVIPSDRLASGVETRAGGVFLPSLLEKDLLRILKVYEENGFPFAKVSIGSISPGETEDEGVGITLVIEEGIAANVSELTIEGNKATKDFVIIREVRLNENQPYTEEMGERIKRRLDRLQLFSTVSLPQFYVSEQGKGGLMIQVAEGNPNRFDGVLGYVPAANQQQKGFVTGLIDVQLRNLFGTGRKLSTRWYRENQASQELALSYTEPWIASLPADVTVGFFQRKQDSTYVRQSYDGSVAVMVTEDLTAGLSVEQASVFPTERPGNSIGMSRQTSIGLSVHYDSRDNPALPTSGVIYRTTYEVGSKIVERKGGDPSRSEDRTGRLTFDLEYFVSPFFRQVIATGVHIKGFRSRLIELSDLFRLGGAATLRGYRESQFLGSRIMWTTVEYRFLAGRRTYLYGFLDGGYIAMPENPSAGLLKSEQTKLGYGVGVRLDTSIGLIGVSLALGEKDTIRTGKLHLRLVNEF